MLKKKICLLGSYGVGKTSLVARFVHSMFADKYHTTVGVKIDKKVLEVEGQELTLMLWDMAGEEDGAPVKLNQVKDTSGYLLVADGTEAKLLMWPDPSSSASKPKSGRALFWCWSTRPICAKPGRSPRATWAELADAGWTILETSAKSGQHVEEAFVRPVVAHAESPGR